MQGMAGRVQARQGIYQPRKVGALIAFRITLHGTAPLLVHNSRLADPLDPATRALKKVSGKGKKTDEDHEELARLEHAGSLYFDSDIGPYVPGQNIERCLVDAAKITRQGVKVTRGVFISTDVNPISYRGPRTVDGLWKDENFRLMASVKIGMKRVMRCRPMFRDWAVEADGILDPAVLDLADLVGIATAAGQMIGLGDWRPRYGRFTAELQQVAGSVAA